MADLPEISTHLHCRQLELVVYRTLIILTLANIIPKIGFKKNIFHSQKTLPEVARKNCTRGRTDGRTAAVVPHVSDRTCKLKHVKGNKRSVT